MMRHIFAYLLCLGFAAGVKAATCNTTMHDDLWHGMGTTTFGGQTQNPFMVHLAVRHNGTLGTAEDAETWRDVSWYTLGVEFPPQSAEECANIDAETGKHCFHLGGHVDFNDEMCTGKMLIHTIGRAWPDSTGFVALPGEGNVAGAQFSSEGLPVAAMVLVRHARLPEPDHHMPFGIYVPAPIVQWEDTGAAAWRITVDGIIDRITRQQAQCNGNSCLFSAGRSGPTQVCTMDSTNGPAIQCEWY